MKAYQYEAMVLLTKRAKKMGFELRATSEEFALIKEGCPPVILTRSEGVEGYLDGWSAGLMVRPFSSQRDLHINDTYKSVLADIMKEKQEAGHDVDFIGEVTDD